tara:strand:+ start:916 stop:1254 length:339 start_codon:yes stop_codon:yes gene_type:complete
MKQDLINKINLTFKEIITGIIEENTELKTANLIHQTDWQGKHINTTFTLVYVNVGTDGKNEAGKEHNIFTNTKIDLLENHPLPLGFPANPRKSTFQNYLQEDNFYHQGGQSV